MITDIKITGTEVLSNYKYRLKKITYDYVKEDGSHKTKSAEVYERGDAATILLYNKQSGTVILTKQFRIPTFVNGNATGMLIEACAGMLEENESPEDAIIREAEEETGYQIKEVEKVFSIYMSPGSLEERIHFFVAEYDNTMKTGKGGGVEAEEENIDVLEVPIQQAMDMIKSGEIKDAKTILLLQHVKLNHLL
jgi:nudix-type nucleoside diphosphatase (YffH/AdpP family)